MKMETKSSLPILLLWVSRAGSILAGLITVFLLVVSFIAVFGGLPDKMNATFEVPVTLKNMEEFYITRELNEKYQSTHFEVKKANLEVLPSNKRWPQFIAFFLASIYVALFLGILIMLSNILKAFIEKRPFSWSNVRMIRWIGYFTIAIAIFELLINAVVSQIFHNKFTIENATLSSMPSFWEINFVALFLGVVFIVLSETFRTGAQLQHLEDLTV